MMKEECEHGMSTKWQHGCLGNHSEVAGLGLEKHRVVVGHPLV